MKQKISKKAFEKETIVFCCLRSELNDMICHRVQYNIYSLNMYSISPNDVFIKLNLCAFFNFLT